MSTIYVVRHGQASFGEADYDQLSTLGYRQADVVGEYLRDQGIRLDAAYSGDLKRQQETARRALACQPHPVPHTVDPRFNEVRNDEHLEYLLPRVLDSHPEIKALVDKGLRESKDYQKVIDAVFNYWVSPACNDDRVQSWADYSGGVRDAMAEVVQTEGSGRTVAIFTSGGTIATIVAQVLGLTGEQTYPFYEPIFNCSITQLFYSGSRVSLSYFNDRSFLQVLGRQAGENLISYR
jgi:broad specificity phosphatase PhoE